MRKSNWDWVAAFLFFVPCLSSFGVVFVYLIDIHQVGEVADRDGPGRRVVGDSPI